MHINDKYEKFGKVSCVREMAFRSDMGLLGSWSCPAPSKMQSVEVPDVYIFVPNWEYCIIRVLVWNKLWNIYVVITNKIFL